MVLRVQSKFKIEIFPDSLHLAGVVCCHGMHYSLFFRHHERWIHLDDSSVKERIREHIHSKTVLFGFFIRILRRFFSSGRVSTTVPPPTVVNFLDFDCSKSAKDGTK